jgi:LmbE family N-acetylglucosaminyl deacetylase
MFKDKTVLAFGPHPDDVEFSCVGTLLKARNEGAKIQYHCFSKNLNQPTYFNTVENFKNSVKAMGLKPDQYFMYDYPNKTFQSVVSDIRLKMDFIAQQSHPDIILCPAHNDIHQDHITLRDCVEQAFKNVTILGYDSIMSNPNFHPQCFVILDEKIVHQKLKICSAYPEVQQLKKYGDPLALVGQMRFYGAKVNAEYAEAFEVIRLIQ